MARDGSARQTLREDYAPPAYWIDAVELCFVLDPQCTRVIATHQIRRAAYTPSDAPLVLDGDGLTFVEAHLDGQKVPTAQLSVSERALSIRDLPAAFTLRVETTCNPAANTALEGLYVTSDTFCTQCEAEGFRRITFFTDRPDVMARYRVTLQAPKLKFPTLLANGNLVVSRDIADGWHEATWEDPFPKPSYLFALVAGDLDVLRDTFTTMSGRVVSLEIYAKPAHLTKCRFAMQALKKAMRWDETRYGRAYDLDRFMIYCADDFNGGAMENKGLNIFNAALLLADSETATDADFAHIEGVVAHEYFHNWSGNRVTCRDWFQLSLKEGFTVFRDQQFSADMGSAAVRRVEDVQFLRQHQFPVDASPLAHAVRPDAYIAIDNFYTTTIYEKGAEVVRMLHTLLGETDFRCGCDLYFERNDGRAATCDDFVAAMESVSGRDLSQFKLWYSTIGTPTLTTSSVLHPQSNRFEMTISQQNPKSNAPLHIPVVVALLDAQGNETHAPQLCELRDCTQTITFQNVTRRPIVSILRGLSAPVRLADVRPAQELSVLAQHDRDGFVRWDAFKTLADAAVGSPIAGAEVDAVFHATIASLLHDVESDPALLGLMLSLAQPQDVEGVAKGTAPSKIVAACETLRMHTGRTHAAALTEVVDRTRASHPYVYAPAEVGRRSLHRAALTLLAAGDPQTAAPLLDALYARSDNMTDQLAALRIYSHGTFARGDAAFADFYKRFSHEPVTLDKWFAVQSVSPLMGTVAHIKALMRDPAFSLSNPNRVRAVVGSFSARNWANFHAPDGNGYAFVADTILQIDKLNGYVAARLVSAFERWPQFDPVSQKGHLDALRLISDTPGISRNLAELTEKMRAG